jgi:hypothetical protein
MLSLTIVLPHAVDLTIVRGHNSTPTLHPTVPLRNEVRLVKKSAEVFEASRTQEERNVMALSNYSKLQKYMKTAWGLIGGPTGTSQACGRASIESS